MLGCVSKMVKNIEKFIEYPIDGINKFNLSIGKGKDNDDGNTELLYMDERLIGKGKYLFLTGKLLRNLYGFEKGFEPSQEDFEYMRSIMEPFCERLPDVPVDLRKKWDNQYKEWIEQFRQHLHNFYAELTGAETILDEPIPINSILDDYFDTKSTKVNPLEAISAEITDLHSTVRELLHPVRGVINARRMLGTKYYTAIRSLQETLHLFPRQKQIFSIPQINELGQIVRANRSNSILALCWAEIWYALEHDVKAGCCSFCGDVFLFPERNFKKAHCGSSNCKQAYIVEQHGGSEKYKEWESSRKKKPSSTKRGRPRKTEKSIKNQEDK